MGYSPRRCKESDMAEQLHSRAVAKRVLRARGLQDLQRVGSVAVAPGSSTQAQGFWCFGLVVPWHV